MSGPADDDGRDGAEQAGFGGDSGPPPHPLDRTWVHPSELPAREPGRDSDRRRALLRSTAMLGAVALGAVLTLAAVWGSGRLEQSGSRDEGSVGVESVASVASVESDISMRDAAEDSVVAVRAFGPEGARVASGVCIRRDGEVLTAESIVRDAQSVVLVDDQGDEHRAEVLGSDADSGLALVVADVTLPTAELDIDSPAVGDRVWAVGATETGAGPWLSEGIVSSDQVRVATLDGPSTTGLLATDVLPGSGSAGGALMDDSGAVVGVVLPPVDGHPTTYAVPMELSLEIAQALRSEGSVQRGRLGLRGDDGPGGVVVIDVDERGPADLAGIGPGDVLTHVDGTPVVAMLDLLAEIRSREPGAIVELRVDDAGRSEVVAVRLDRDRGDAPDGRIAQPVSSG